MKRKAKTGFHCVDCGKRIRGLGELLRHESGPCPVIYPPNLEKALR